MGSPKIWRLDDFEMELHFDDLLVVAPRAELLCEPLGAAADWSSFHFGPFWDNFIGGPTFYQRSGAKMVQRRLKCPSFVFFKFRVFGRFGPRDGIRPRNRQIL